MRIRVLVAQSNEHPYQYVSIPLSLQEAGRVVHYSVISSTGNVYGQLETKAASVVSNTISLLSSFNQT
jgi:hypothetical protein